MKIALTGGMGCGKSSAAAAFSARGRVKVLCADSIAKDILENNARVRLEVERLLGGAVFIRDGERFLPDRKAIAKKIFSDEILLSEYEEIIHPLVIERILNFESAPELGATESADITIVEIPLLFEKKLEKFFDMSLTVFCSEEIRLKRLGNRGMSLSQIMERDAFQLPPVRKAELADVVLFNESDIDFLKRQTDAFISRL